MNYLIWWSINTWKLEFINKMISEGKVKEEDVLHWDNLRRELFDELSEEEQKKYFPKMWRIFTNKEKWIDIIQELWIQKYLELEVDESKFVFEKKIKPIIESMSDSTNKLIAWVQLLPELVEKWVKWKENISSIFLVRDNVETIVEREMEYALESEGQKNYIETLSSNTIENWEAPNQYLLHAKAKAEYWKMIREQLEKLELSPIIIDTSLNFNTKILNLLSLVK